MNKLNDRPTITQPIRLYFAPVQFVVFISVTFIASMTIAQEGPKQNSEQTIETDEAQASKHLADKHNTTPLKGFIDLNGYYDIRETAGFTVNTLASLPWRFQYFSLVNYYNANDSGHIADMDGFYSEQNLRWKIAETIPVQLAMQWVLRADGDTDNDMLRFGFRWLVSSTPGIKRLCDFIHFRYAIGLYLYQLDYMDAPGWRTQIEHVYRLDILPKLAGKRIYIGGFLDHSLWFSGPESAADSKIVTEHQLGIRIVGGLHVVAELRRNEYLADKQNGLGIGLEYVIPFFLQNSK